MMEVQQEAKGIMMIGGQNCNNIRYADDAVMLSDGKSELQCMIIKLNNVCKEYGMDINVKKTKTLVINKSGHINCAIMMNGSVLEQVSPYKYLGSWITEDGKCELDVKSKIGMAKDTFWKHKQLLRGNICLKVKQEDIRLLRLSCARVFMRKLNLE